MYDYVIVGAGFFGATFARQVTDAGKSCLVIDKRNHIAGNCHSESHSGIEVHTYGPHVLHTGNDRIWSFMQRFAKINHYRHRAYTRARGKVYSLPINLMTLNQLRGINTPEKARAYFARVVEDCPDETIEGWCLRTIGRELYELLIKEYTEKQWGCSPAELPEFIVKRLPVRLDYNNDYFRDKYQGIPIGGYTTMVQQMLDGIPVWLGTDFLKDRKELESLGRRVVYSGSPDELFDCDVGRLPYRSLRTELEYLDVEDYQGVTHMNYADKGVPWHRITEYKHYTFTQCPHTIIMREFAAPYIANKNEPCYPINTDANNLLARYYVDRARASGYIVGGRLGSYKYLDMDQTIGQAMKLAAEALRGDS